MDGMIWTGLSNGSLVQWDGNGNRQWEVQHHFSSVMCLFAFGIHLWVGYADGTVQILDLVGSLIGGWVAHGGPVIKMDVGASYIFTLANHGGIRGWCLTSPGLIDDILRRELSNKELVCTKIEQLEILVGTWNVGQGRASFDSLISWLGCAATDVDLVVVGLQEVEMGAGSLAIAAAKETIGLEGSANGQWWLDTIGKILDEGTSFERIGSRQLAGLLIASWVRKSIRPGVGDVDAAAVACGFGRTIGNKGAVGLRMRVFERMLCFVNCHFAAHLDAVSKRNADFDHVYRNLTFTRPSMAPNSFAAAATSVQVSHGGNSTTSQNDEKPELSEADMVVFFGDFNYRLFGISYDEARDMLSQRSFDWLKEKDQLRAEMNAGRVFQGMREAQFMFPPTYKFERHQCGLSAYDSSEKKRIPAWCDRIVYRDSRSNMEAECSLECPVISSVKLYESSMDVTDSDHKPVRCIFGVEIAHIDRTTMRKQFGAISTLKEDGCPSEICTKGSFGFPSWLQVQPAAGIIKPGHVMEVKLHHDDFETHEEFVDGVPQNWWCVDNRDKEVVLLVEVRGSYSTDTRDHQIHVRHCCSNRKPPGNTKLSSDKPPTIQNLLQRSDFANFSSSDVMNLNHMSCP
ncbi:hypothetical protein HPP92_024956 [Vanilla planifolia]|uniref:Inositol polyphosphate-related phosphatase domain-containing protein n=1 Tax=Vanilla planifolia TaxID=51239 RepID=A0A835U9R3_VANPL|nr:hypothetical protein HPP92_024956 [Vanilla planifolia]